MTDALTFALQQEAIEIEKHPQYPIPGTVALALVADWRKRGEEIEFLRIQVSLSVDAATSAVQAERRACEEILSTAIKKAWNANRSDSLAVYAQLEAAHAAIAARGKK